MGIPALVPESALLVLGRVPAPPRVLSVKLPVGRDSRAWVLVPVARVARLHSPELLPVLVRV
ncbi:MAG: hypothetical protein WCO77_12645 [bacterium]